MEEVMTEMEAAELQVLEPLEERIQVLVELAFVSTISGSSVTYGVGGNGGYNGGPVNGADGTTNRG